MFGAFIFFGMQKIFKEFFSNLVRNFTFKIVSLESVAKHNRSFQTNHHNA